jgi:hypothetical protein
LFESRLEHAAKAPLLARAGTKRTLDILVVDDEAAGTSVARMPATPVTVSEADS